MRKHRHKAAIALAALVSTLTGSAVASAEPAADTATGRHADLTAFARILADQQAAWFAEDGAGFAATFWHDADLVTFNGDHLSTRDGIATGMQYYFDNFMDPTHIRVLSEEVTFAGPNLAVIVRTSCLLIEPDAPCREDSESANTNVMVKKWGRWLQQSFQNTRKFAIG
ncbi:SgcJ/EcaC family oxidoreductase [Phytomonospora sp. NPDC050363]|uniref:SgcJ/EcaC family oxidoreductase n=1 Tax=Phytomonospora sp. NPDC050363 TaxID=3155642 RepID=UPI00340C3539